MTTTEQTQTQLTNVEQYSVTNRPRREWYHVNSTFGQRWRVLGHASAVAWRNGRRWPNLSAVVWRRRSSADEDVLVTQQLDNGRLHPRQEW